jgi:hypothetical protein
MQGMTLQEALQTPEVRSYLREIVRDELGAGTRTLRETPKTSDERQNNLRAFGERRGLTATTMEALGLRDPEAA